MIEFGFEACCGLAFLWFSFPEETSIFYCIIYLYFYFYFLFSKGKFAHMKKISCERKAIYSEAFFQAKI